MLEPIQLRRQLSEGTCRLHGDVRYLLIPTVGALVCEGCLMCGLYSVKGFDEAKRIYPEIFLDTAADPIEPV
jgi:hypothetical protein